LDEYLAHKFIEHPKVTSLLALTSLEREGKTIAAALEKFNDAKDKTTIRRVWSYVLRNWRMI